MSRVRGLEGSGACNFGKYAHNRVTAGRLVKLTELIDGHGTHAIPRRSLHPSISSSESS
jgi:hypothetical protein